MIASTVPVETCGSSIAWPSTSDLAEIMATNVCSAMLHGGPTMEAEVEPTLRDIMGAIRRSEQAVGNNKYSKRSKQT